MNPEQQRIAIAEFCPFLRVAKHSGQIIWNRDGFEQDVDPLADLNLWHVIEETLSNDAGYNYDMLLCVITDAYKDGPCNHMRLYHATAQQRAEALLRTIGKWQTEKEGEK